MTQNQGQSQNQEQNVDLDIIISNLEKEIGEEKMEELRKIAKSEEEEEGKFKKVAKILGGFGQEVLSDISAKMILGMLGGQG